MYTLDEITVIFRWFTFPGHVIPSLQVFRGKKGFQLNFSLRYQDVDDPNAWYPKFRFSNLIKKLVASFLVNSTSFALRSTDFLVILLSVGKAFSTSNWKSLWKLRWTERHLEFFPLFVWDFLFFQRQFFSSFHGIKFSPLFNNAFQNEREKTFPQKFGLRVKCTKIKNNKVWKFLLWCAHPKIKEDSFLARFFWPMSVGCLCCFRCRRLMYITVSYNIWVEDKLNSNPNRYLIF